MSTLSALLAATSTLQELLLCLELAITSGLVHACLLKSDTTGAVASDLLGAGNIVPAWIHTQRLDQVVSALCLWLCSRLRGGLLDVLPHLLLTLAIGGSLGDIHKLELLIWVALVVDLGLSESLLLSHGVVGTSLAEICLSTLCLLRGGRIKNLLNDTGLAF